MAKIDAVVLNCDNVLEPGMPSFFLVIPATGLTAFPQTTNEATPLTANNSGEVTLATAFTYTAPADYWRKSPIFQNSGSVKASRLGDVTNSGYANEFSGMWADDVAEIRGFMRRLDRFAKCGGFLVAIPQRDGSYRIIGDLNTPAYVKAGEFMTGDKPGGQGRESKLTLASDGIVYYDYPSALTPPRIAPTV